MVAPPRGLSHCAVFGSFEPAPLLRDADFAAECREQACIAHFHGTAFHGSDPCSLGTWLAEARIRAFSEWRVIRSEARMGQRRGR
jgi:hypothetical protein